MASTVNIFSGESNWLASTLTAIKSQDSQYGILGALQGSNDGSIKSLLTATRVAGNAFATISQNNVTSASSFYAQIAAQNQQKRQKEQLEKAFADLQRTQSMVQPTNVLDDYIYFDNGSYLDTKNNILTMSDGKQVDTVTGTEVVDPSTVIQMANGAYLNTKTNVMTLSDGTKIDTVTGLKI